MKNHSDFEIRYYGHPDLRKKAKPVKELTSDILDICEEMVKKMSSLSHCIGFAGPQLGINLRIFVIREQMFSDDGSYLFKTPEVIINPVLFNPSEELESMSEGCMSLPDLYVEVIRPKSIDIRYMNLDGKEVEERLSDFRARMFMHENDHLNGVLHIDRMDPKERKKIDEELREMKKKYQISKN